MNIIISFSEHSTWYPDPHTIDADPDPIHKIWWIRIRRIQDNKITKFISNHVLKGNKKKYFQICT